VVEDPAKVEASQNS